MMHNQASRGRQVFASKEASRAENCSDRECFVVAAKSCNVGAHIEGSLADGSENGAKQASRAHVAQAQTSQIVLEKLLGDGAHILPFAGIKDVKKMSFY